MKPTCKTCPYWHDRGVQGTAGPLTLPVTGSQEYKTDEDGKPVAVEREHGFNYPESLWDVVGQVDPRTPEQRQEIKDAYDLAVKDLQREFEEKLDKWERGGGEENLDGQEAGGAAEPTAGDALEGETP